MCGCFPERRDKVFWVNEQKTTLKLIITIIFRRFECDLGWLRFCPRWSFAVAFPEVSMQCFCSPRMESKPEPLKLAGQEVTLIGALTGCTTPGQSGPGCNEGKGEHHSVPEVKLPQRMQFNVIPRKLFKDRLIFIWVGISQWPYCC